MRPPSPAGYEAKSTDFIQLCRDSKKNGVGVVLIEHPSALGDTKEELIESLYRLSDHGLRLEIASETEPGVGLN